MKWQIRCNRAGRGSARATTGREISSWGAHKALLRPWVRAAPAQSSTPGAPSPSEPCWHKEAGRRIWKGLVDWFCLLNTVREETGGVTAFGGAERALQFASSPRKRLFLGPLLRASARGLPWGYNFP